MMAGYLTCCLWITLFAHGILGLAENEVQENGTTTLVDHGEGDYIEETKIAEETSTQHHTSETPDFNTPLPTLTTEQPTPVAVQQTYYLEDFYSDKGNLTVPITKDESGLVNTTLSVSINTDVARSLNLTSIGDFYRECIKNLKGSNPVLEKLIIRPFSLEFTNCDISIINEIPNTDEYTTLSTHIVHAIAKSLNEFRLKSAPIELTLNIRSNQLRKDSITQISINTNYTQTLENEPIPAKISLQTRTTSASECPGDQL
ncbi:unnamed protein product [Bursaphelenchus xylophilus]|uniref:(pine wood nematode) hypothetical protein n=1 Tax=Bursaphelenchus xylophilus TaxID=6326 RepID=A0A1I7SAZ1_BURXY|nr:unnamed protein product [Bursaphelenchus xylophilus]CAG9106019.1 unnamed protein product [Bursaphelenchus xylophilus]